MYNIPGAVGSLEHTSSRPDAEAERGTDGGLDCWQQQRIKPPPWCVVCSCSLPYYVNARNEPDDPIDAKLEPERDVTPRDSRSTRTGAQAARRVMRHPCHHPNPLGEQNEQDNRPPFKLQALIDPIAVSMSFFLLSDEVGQGKNCG